MMAFRLLALCKCAKGPVYGYTNASTSTAGISVFIRTFRTPERVQVLQKQWMSSRRKTLPFEVDTTKLSKDVLVFSHENERFYNLLTFFGCAQFAFWAYLALFSFQTLRDVPVEPQQETEMSWWRRIAAKETKYKNGISVLCFCFGYIILCISVMYPSRSVRSLWVLKGGNSVRVDTYSVLPKQRTITVPVNTISCLQTRADAAAQIPMKIKDKWFFFLLDKRGKFHNTELFDFFVGLNRAVKLK